MDQAGAEDLIHVAFGPGQGLLADHHLCSAHSLSSADSVQRAQVLAHQSLHDGMCKRLRSTLARADRTSTIVIKRLWDETSLRVQLSLTDLKRVLGEDVADVADDVKRRSRGGRGSVYPGYVVQSMQQKAYIRCGRDVDSAMEIITPAKLISTADADSIYKGIRSALPALEPH